MERIAWALIRSELQAGLALELRICIETLWALPGQGTPFAVTLLPSSILVGLDGTVELGMPEPADLRYFQRYLAPELVRGEAPTLSSATYAVGALLFEALSGAPFRASRSVERELAYLGARAQATGLGPDATDTGLLQIAARATRTNPHERWATPEAFSRELDRSAGHCIQSREELARHVRRILRRRGPARAHQLQTLANELVVPVTSLDGQTAKRRPKSPLSRADAVRIRTMRGFALDLSSYPPPRPSPHEHPRPAAAGPAPAAERPPLPAPSAPVCSNDRPPEAPASSMRPATLTVRGSGDSRPVALVTALVVAIPLIVMTLWNWRASARAAALSAPPSIERTLDARPKRSTSPLAVVAPARSPAIAVAPPAIAARPLPPVAEPARVRRPPERPPTFKPRGPFDYGI